jgi:hypothetical protein
MTPDGAKKAAQWVRSNVVNKGGERLSSMLDMVASKEGASRNAILFSIQQNPEYREILEKLTGTNPVKEQNE